MTMVNIDLLIFPLVLLFQVFFFFIAILLAFTLRIDTTYDYFFHKTAHKRSLVLGIYSILEMNGIVQWVVYFLTQLLLIEMQIIYWLTQSSTYLLFPLIF